MYDIIIIGSGPAGLSAAVYAKRANLDIAVVEKEYEGSGQIAESGNVNNYLGLPNINGYELGEKFRNHALSLEVPFIEKEALGISKIDCIHSWSLSKKGRHKGGGGIPWQGPILLCHMRWSLLQGQDSSGAWRWRYSLGRCALSFGYLPEGVCGTQKR